MPCVAAGGMCWSSTSLMRPASSGRPPTVPAPLVLPVAHQARKEEVDEARRQYRVVLRSPTKFQVLLGAIDDLIAARAKARPRRVASVSG